MREHWDRALLYLMVGGYGVVSLDIQSPSMAMSPPWISLPVYIMFLIASPALLVGFFCNYMPLFVVGHILGVIGLLTVAAVIAVLNPNPGALLLLALATALFVSIRTQRRVNNTLAAMRSDR